jgi:hypothetical protein
MADASRRERDKQPECKGGKEWLSVHHGSFRIVKSALDTRVSLL